MGGLWPAALVLGTEMRKGTGLPARRAGAATGEQAPAVQPVVLVRQLYSRQRHTPDRTGRRSGTRCGSIEPIDARSTAGKAIKWLDHRPCLEGTLVHARARLRLRRSPE